MTADQKLDLQLRRLAHVRRLMRLASRLMDSGTRHASRRWDDALSGPDNLEVQRRALNSANRRYAAARRCYDEAGLVATARLTSGAALADEDHGFKVCTLCDERIGPRDEAMRDGDGYAHAECIDDASRERIGIDASDDADYDRFRS